MLSRDEKLRLKTLISDTVVLLCKNGLVSKLKGEFSIEGLIGISLEENDLMLVSINEKLRGSQPEILNKSEHSSQSESDTDQQNTASSRRKRHKRKNKKSIETVEEASPRKNASVNFRTENSPFHLRHQPSPALVHTDTVAFHHQTNTRQPQPAIIQPVSSTIHHQSPDSKSFNVSSNDHLVQPPQSTSHLQMPYISETSSAVGTIGSTDYLLADNSATGDSFLDSSQLNIKKEHYDSETDTNEELILVKEEGKNQPVMDNNFPVEPQIQHFVANQAALLTGDATAPAHTIVSVPASGPIVADNAQEENFLILKEVEQTTEDYQRLTNILPKSTKHRKGPLSRSAVHGRIYREKMKEHGNYEAYKESERIRKKNYREKMKNNEEWLKKSREAQRVRAKRYREKQKLRKLPPVIKKQLTESEKQQQREYWKNAKRKSREKFINSDKKKDCDTRDIIDPCNIKKEPLE